MQRPNIAPILTLLVAISAGLAEASTPLCGVSLHGAAAHLLITVERGFGSRVRCSTKDSLRSEEAALAQSGVSYDGVPWIALDKSQGVNEAQIVHELFHLKLKARGFPRELAIVAPPNLDPELVRLAAVQLTSLLEHRLFYPEMRGMGFNPAREYRTEVEGYVHGKPLPSAAEKYPELQTIGYASVALLLKDRAFTSKVEKWYEQKHWTQQLAHGRDVVSYIQTSDPRTPQQETEAVLRCLEIVFDQRFSIGTVR